MANRPVRPEHQAITPEYLVDGADVRLEIIRCPRVRVGFGHHPGELAGDVLEVDELVHQRRPFGDLPRGDRGLGDVVDHEAEVREVPGNRDGVGKFPRADEQVVDEPGIGNGLEIDLHRLLQQPVGILLVVHLVAYADEVGAVLTRSQVRQRPVHLRVGEIDPADHARDEVGPLGDGQELPRLLDVVDRLDEDRSVDPVGFEVGPEILRPKGPRNSGVSQPWIGTSRRIPEMMMAVDAFRWRKIGHGAPSQRHDTRVPQRAGR